MVTLVTEEMDDVGKKDVELETFLRNVNEVDSIIKGLASNESLATEKADEFLQRYQRNTQIADSGTSVDRYVAMMEIRDSLRLYQAMS